MYDGGMAKKKPSSDVNVNAFEILQTLTGEHPHHAVSNYVKKPKKKDLPSKKNPAAVALGRLGGLKGGKARAEKLSAMKRNEIAKNAAKTRWSKRSKLSWLFM